MRASRDFVLARSVTASEVTGPSLAAVGERHEYD